MEFELIIQNESDIYLPLVEDSIVWKTERKGVPGQLDFKILDDGKRDVYISQDGNNINKWGVLQYFDTISEGENGKAKADALLSLYNQKARTLSVKNAFGDIRVRGGSMVVVQLDLGDTKINNLMIVEKCKHEFKNNEHFMDLTLRGGEFIA